MALTVGGALGCALLVQLARVLIKDRPRMRSLPPFTALLILLSAALAAAQAAGYLPSASLTLTDADLFSEPWRLVGALLSYRSVEGFATHSCILLLLGERLEPALTSATFGCAFAVCSFTSLALRQLMLEEGSRPTLMAPAPLFSLIFLHGALAAAAPTPPRPIHIGGVSVSARQLPWALLAL